MEIVRKINGADKETTIKHEWIAPAASVFVRIGNAQQDNSSAHFTLEIEGGQTEFTSNPNGGILEMWGDWERECFVELLKQIIIELELIDEK
jgi:hypothetical protein